MKSITMAETSAILNAYDFSQCKRVVDFGGGNGALMAAILSRSPVHGELVILAAKADFLPKIGSAIR